MLLDEAQASEVESRLAPALSLDPHSDTAAGNGYRLTSLYCDTPALDVFHRAGRFRLFKFRIRRYGNAPQIYLERKAKQGTKVRKRRWTIGLEELSRLGRQEGDADWAGAWYQRQIVRNNFRPVCVIRYERMAYFGASDNGPVRLTFDREIYGAPVDGWSLMLPQHAFGLLQGRVVCEFKFRGQLPAAFKRVMSELKLVPCGVSKFRHCLRSAGIVEDGACVHA